MKEDTNSIEAVAITARDVATAAEIFMVGMLCWVLGVGLCWCLVLAVHAWRAVEEHKK